MDPDFAIEGGRRYSPTEIRDGEGPMLTDTYIGFSTTLSDIADYYTLPPAYSFAVEEGQPIILGPNNTRFSFVLEEGFLTFNWRRGDEILTSEVFKTRTDRLQTRRHADLFRDTFVTGFPTGRNHELEEHFVRRWDELHDELRQLVKTGRETQLIIPLGRRTRTALMIAAALGRGPRLHRKLAAMIVGCTAGAPWYALEELLDAEVKRGTGDADAHSVVEDLFEAARRWQTFEHHVNDGLAVLTRIETGGWNSAPRVQPYLQSDDIVRLVETPPDDDVRPWIEELLDMADGIEAGAAPLQPPSPPARVEHAKFGLGTVVEDLGDRLVIDFADAGRKTLLRKFVEDA